MAVLNAQGRRTGGVPYGFRAEGKRLGEDAGEQATVARARELRGEGKSLRKIGAALATEGRLPRNGKDWAIQTVRRIVQAAR